MKITHWAAAAVLAATIPVSTLAQGGATSPVAPRTSAPATGVEGKVAVIDTGKFYDGILEIKTKEDQVQKKYDQQIKDLQNLKNQIDQTTKTLQSLQPTGAPDKLQQMADQLADMQKRYQRQGEDLQAAIQKDNDAALGPIRQKLQTFVQSYATQRGIVLILDKGGAYQSGTIAYMNDAIDITADFITEYNKANPVPGAAPAAAPRGAK